MAAIELRSVGKKYRAYSSRREQLKEILSFGKAGKSHDFWALKDIDLTIEPGATLGILGRNGAGKSTLLKVISGVVTPSTGTAQVNGRLAALFGLGAGFNPEFTGRDNVMLNGLLLGLERDEVLDRIPEIEAFADIGPFMDQPVKTYSSGMRARLGFAVATSVEPDILVVDETLSVGDAVFKQASLQRMQDLRDRGTTILFVSHSMGMVQNFCNQALLLHKGELLVHGGIDATLEKYQELLGRAKAKRNMPTADAKMEYMIEHEEEEDLENARRPANRNPAGPRITNIELLDAARNPTDTVDPDAATTIRVHVEYPENTTGGRIGFVVRDASGLDILASDTAREDGALGERRAGERATVDFTTNFPLRPGRYSVHGGVSGGANEPLAWAAVAAEFGIPVPPGGPAVQDGLVHLPTTVEIHTDTGREQERPSRSA